MACRRRYEVWRRAWRRSATNARGILLAVVGIALLMAGVVLASESIGLTLIWLGVGVLALGIVLPLVVEVAVGPGGLTIKQAFRERDAEIEPLVLAENETNSLQRFARLLTGDVERAPVVVEEALARTYRVWTDIPERDLNLHILCALVRVALGAGKLRLLGGGGPATASPPTTPASADEVSSTDQALASLPMDVRAVLLLRHVQDVDEPHIAWILGRPVATVAETLRRSEAILEERVGVVTEGSA